MKRTLHTILLAAIALTTSTVWASEVNFDETEIFVSESDGVATVTLSVDEVGVFPVFVALQNQLNKGTAVQGEDFDFQFGFEIIPAFSNGIMTFEIPIIDNDEANSDRFFILKIAHAVYTEIGEDDTCIIYIKDDESVAPQASEELDIEFFTSYLVDEDGSAEIVAHDPETQRLFVMNSEISAVEILDFSNPAAIIPIQTLDLTAYGPGGTSIAVQDGIVAATVEGADYSNGTVVFFDTDGNELAAVEVGNLPDMVCFTPDGTKVLTANEGEPNDDFSIDPEGTISIIDISGGVDGLTNADVTTIGFGGLEFYSETLQSQGLRIMAPGASMAEDLEPEYITVSEDSETAWVSLQENNAIALIDLTVPTIRRVYPLGTIDHSLPGNSLDVSDKIDEIFMANWNIHGMFMPDAIASYQVGATTYVITANEGDQREYDSINEDTSVEDDDVIILDPTAYPNAEYLIERPLLGRLAVSPYSGDTDGDGDIDILHSFGTRSFSIWNGKTGQLVYDSGDDFERITAADAEFGGLFNASNSNNNFKNRSDNKGPEPEGVTTAEINGETYAFITLERVGGVMTYNVSNPNAPVFVDYSNSRTTDGEDEGGDLGPEGVLYIAPEDSPTGFGMLLLANEVSATVSIYAVNSDVLLSSNVNDEESSETEEATFETEEEVSEEEVTQEKTEINETAELEQNNTNSVQADSMSLRLQNNGSVQQSLINFPNPFSTTTTINFTASTDGRGMITVYNNIGSIVAEVFEAEVVEGANYQVEFDAQNLPAGIYHLALYENGAQTQVIKMSVIR